MPAEYHPFASPINGTVDTLSSGTSVLAENAYLILQRYLIYVEMI